MNQITFKCCSISVSFLFFLERVLTRFVPTTGIASDAFDLRYWAAPSASCHPASVHGDGPDIAQKNFVLGRFCCVRQAEKKGSKTDGQKTNASFSCLKRW